MSKENVETVVLEEEYLKKLVKQPDPQEEASGEADGDADED